MQYRHLGKWGVQVSSVSLGSWLTFGGTITDDVAEACVDRAYELGVNFFDTANIYERGAAEQVMGKSLAKYPRDSFVLATKVFWPMTDFPNGGGLSRKHVFEQAHQSLQRLGMDYIDLYQCHRWDTEAPLEETCWIMDDLVRQGKILYWGVSEWTAEQIQAAVDVCRAEGWAVPVSNQPQYSALYRRIEKDVLPTCEKNGMGNVVWSPLGGGILTGKYTSATDIPKGTRATTQEGHWMSNNLRPEVLDAVQHLKKLAEEAGCTIAQLSLAWCLREPGVSSVIIGATSPKHIEENVSASDLRVDHSLMEAVDTILGPLASYE